MKYGILLYICLIVSTLGVSNNYVDILQEIKIHESSLIYSEKVNEEFIQALAHQESSGRLNVINHIGAMGLWQFNYSTLKDLGMGHITTSKFRLNPSVFDESIQRNALSLKIRKDIYLLKTQWWRKSNSVDYISKYVGKEIDGVKITLAGILAAAHLGGSGGVIKFFDSKGSYNPSDLYNTSIKNYLVKFSKYDYIEVAHIKTKIICLKESLNTLKSSLPKISMLYFLKENLNDMGTALILHNLVNLHPISQKSQLFIYLSGSKLPYQNGIEGLCFCEALLPKDMGYPVPMDTVRLNGIIAASGKELLKLMRIHNPFLKELEYFSFT